MAYPKLSPTLQTENTICEAPVCSRLVKARSSANPGLASNHKSQSISAYLMHRILTGICLIQMVKPGKSLPQRGLSSRSRTFLPWSTASRSCPLWWHTGSNPRDPRLSLLFYPRRTGYSYLCNKPNTLSFALETQPSIWQAQTPGTKSTRQLISASKTVFQKPRSWDSHTCLVPFPWIWTYDLL